MAQKSILSFFKTADRPISNEIEKSFEKPKKEESTKREKIAADDSPVKRGRNKRKVKCIESDDDSNDVQNKVVNGNSEENEIDAVEHKENSSKNPEKISVQIKSKKKANGKSARKSVKKTKTENEENEKQPDSPTKVVNGSSEEKENDAVEYTANSSKSPEHISVQIKSEKKVNRRSARKPAKTKEIENVESEKHSDSPIKMEVDNTDHNTMETSETNVIIEAVSSCSTQNDVVEFIPKRKTARKQMSSVGNSKKKDFLIKDKIVNSKETNDTEAISTAKTITENERLILKSNEASPKQSVDSDKSESSNEDVSESAKLEDKTENCNNKPDNYEKSSPSSNKKSNSEKDESKRKKVKVPVDTSAKKSTDGRLKANRKETKKNTPLKKSSKNDSIQSFFTPLKKPADIDKKEDSDKTELEEDKDENIDDKNEADELEKSKDQAKNEEDNEIEEESMKDEKSKKAKHIKKNKKDIKSEPEENEDSPVKMTRSRKKKICLDSDEEDEVDPSSISVKMEIDDAENNPDASEGKDISTRNDKLSESKPGRFEKTDAIISNEKSKTSERKTVSNSDKESSKGIASKNKTSPLKKEATTSSTNDEEKKAFGAKGASVTRTVFDPSKDNYHPIEDACWKQNEKVPYLALAKTLELIENTSGRLKTIEILSNFLRSVIVLSPNDLLQSVYLCLNRLAPEYEGIELGVGETLLMKAVAQATGRTLEKIKAEVAVKGDLGLVSESSRGNQRVMFPPPKLTVASVFSKFLEIAKMSGNAAMGKKTDKIQTLFVACRDSEARYIVRSLSGKLRIGLAEQSVLTAIARAVVLTPPGQDYPPKVVDASKGMSEKKFKEFLDAQTLILKTAYCECPNYDLIIPVLLKEGLAALPERCQLSPGRPLKPMLAHPTTGIDIVLDRFDKNAFTCEFKYDGERAQIHMTENGDVSIFSRNQENNTSKYPDIISRIPKALKETTKSFILDSEAVAWDKESKQILPFQVLSTRKKKDAVESEIVVQVCIMAFDLLYLNGESLVKKPLKERRSLLHSSFQEVESEFMFAQYKDGNSAEIMQEFLDESVKGNCEGLMVKALEVDASYEIAKRSHNWLKLKKDYLQGVGDTLDLVVIGGYFGKGKRTGNYGGFLLACYDDENEEFQSICKLGTGFKDENLEAHTEFLKKHTIKEPKSYYRYDSSLKPDEWFEAVQVWEIKCADLSISPIHKAAIGIVDPEKGISLRFPRFIRIRDDKTPENATNSAQIADMYQKQQHIQNTSNKNAKNDEDYY